MAGFAAAAGCCAKVAEPIHAALIKITPIPRACRFICGCLSLKDVIISPRSQVVEFDENAFRIHGSDAIYWQPLERRRPMSPKRATESTAVHLFLDLANNLLKLSGAIVLFGYISLRARMNRLGIAAPDVPADRYLMEAYNLLASILFTAGLIFLKAGIAILVIVLVVRLVRRRAAFPLDAWISRIPGRAYLLFSCGVLAFLENWIPNTLLSVKHDVLVTDAGPSAFVQPVQFPLFLLIVAAYAGATGALWVIRGLPMVGIWRALRMVALILTALVGLQLPLLYGFAVQEYAAPAVSVRPKSAPLSERSCGLLVNDSSTTVTVWVPSQHRLLQFPRADLEGIRLGAVMALAGVMTRPAEFEEVCTILNGQ